LLFRQLLDFGAKFLTSVRLAEPQVEIHELLLEEQPVSGIRVVQEGSDQTKGGIALSLEPPSAGAAVNHCFPVDALQFPFSSGSGFFVDLVPHSGGEDNVLERIFPTKFLEHAQVLKRGPSHAIV